MRRTVLALVGLLAAGGVLSTKALLRDAAAQTPPAQVETAQVETAPPATMPPGGMPHPQGPWHHEDWHHAWHHGGPWGQRPFALLYHPADRALSADDVQKIAQAFLLWNGNHDWKIADVTANQDGTVSFTVTTGNGGTIARFAMDSHSGRISRTG